MHKYLRSIHFANLKLFSNTRDKQFSTVFHPCIRFLLATRTHFRPDHLWNVAGNCIQHSSLLVAHLLCASMASLFTFWKKVCYLKSLPGPDQLLSIIFLFFLKHLSGLAVTAIICLCNLFLFDNRCKCILIFNFYSMIYRYIFFLLLSTQYL